MLLLGPLHIYREKTSFIEYDDTRGKAISSKDLIALYLESLNEAQQAVS